jgi:Spy/CpxP family protein refolding chaperone
MTRSRALFAFVLVAAALYGLAACAQPGGDSGGTGLLQMEQVQDDLHLTDEQRVQVLSLTMELRGNRTMLAERLDGMLKPEQRKRLQEIRLQVEGPAAMMRPDVTKALDLSPAQRDQLKTLMDGVRKKVRQVVEEAKGLSPEEQLAKRDEIMERMREVQKDTIARALDVLSAEQREKFEKMQGRKIDLDTPLGGPKKRPAPAATLKGGEGK